MLTENLRFFCWRKFLNFSQIIFILRLMSFLFWRLFFWDNILRRVGITKSMLFFWNNCLVEIFISINFEKSTIPIISYSTTISHFSNQISHSIPRRHSLYNRLFSSHRALSLFDLLGLFNIYLQYLISSIPVRIIEVIYNIPTKSFKSFSFNNKRMIPTQAVKHSSVSSPIWSTSLMHLFWHIWI